jgi:TPR repeat protein
MELLAGAESMAEEKIGGADNQGSLDVEHFDRLYNRLSCGDENTWKQVVALALDDNNPFAQAVVAVFSADKNSLMTSDMTPAAQVLADLSLKWLSRELNASCRVAQCLIGLFLYHDLDVGYAGSLQERQALIVELMTMSSAQDCVVAMYWLGRLDSTSDTSTAARNLYRAASDSGFAPAQYYLGRCIQDGSKLVPFESMRLFRVAALQGFPGAQLALGAHLLSTGLDNDVGEGARLYTLAASQTGEGAYYLGCLQQSGKGVPKDVQAATEMLQRSAATGYGPAYYELGKLFRDERRDTTTANKYFSQASALGVAEARFALGMLHWNCGNREMAVKVLENAAIQGCADAAYMLGTMLEKNQGYSGLPWDALEAVKYYQVADAKNHPSARIALARCYRTGTGLPKNPSKAIEIYTEMTTKDTTGERHFDVANCYAEDLTDLQNLILAITWHQEASKLGFNRSKTLLRRIRSDLENATGTV